MKKRYETPKVKLVMLMENEDIITLSGTDDGTGKEWDWNNPPSENVTE